jgi:hypothetical protein
MVPGGVPHPAPLFSEFFPFFRAHLPDFVLHKVSGITMPPERAAPKQQAGKDEQQDCLDITNFRQKKKIGHNGVPDQHDQQAEPGNGS